MDLQFAVTASRSVGDPHLCLAALLNVCVWGSRLCMARSFPLRATLLPANQTQPPGTLNGEPVVPRSRDNADLIVGRGAPAAAIL